MVPLMRKACLGMARKPFWDYMSLHREMKVGLVRGSHPEFVRYDNSGASRGISIGNITPIVQEHEGMSCLVGDSRRQVLGRW